jgi:hypothetical protein
MKGLQRWAGAGTALASGLIFATLPVGQANSAALSTGQAAWAAA